MDRGRLEVGAHEPRRSGPGAPRPVARPPLLPVHEDGSWLLLVPAGTCLALLVAALLGGA